MSKIEFEVEVRGLERREEERGGKEVRNALRSARVEGSRSGFDGEVHRGVCEREMERE